MEVETLTTKIRKENAQDYPSVYNVNTNAFKRKEEARLVDRLRLSDAFVPELSLVATIDEHVAGYILFTEIHILDGDRKIQSLALAPVAVSPQHQRKGIGRLLVTHGLKEAKRLGYKSVIVLGSDTYYPQFGFTPTSKWQIAPPLNIPENVFMGLEFEEGSLSTVKGIVKYPREFDMF